MFEYTNELAILVSAILAIAIASIWYSPVLFGGVWLKSIGRSMREEELPKTEMIGSTIKAVLAHIVFFIIVTYFIEVGEGAMQRLVTTGGFITALIFIYTVNLAIWERRPYTYVLIHTGYIAAVVFGGIGVIAYWPW